MSDLFCEEVSMEGWRVEVSGDVCEGAELFCEGVEGWRVEVSRGWSFSVRQWSCSMRGWNCEGV